MQTSLLTGRRGSRPWLRFDCHFWKCSEQAAATEQRQYQSEIGNRQGGELMTFNNQVDSSELNPKCKDR